MQLTPSQAYDHIRESLASYLETAYKISHPSVHAERASLLRARGTISQAPFIEATPAFPAGRMLHELEREHPELVTEGLSDLVRHGVPVDRFPLYVHQETALLAGLDTATNLLVATGTGSGKTEAFLLPILADILREGRDWPEVGGHPRRGEWDTNSRRWLHSRRHERRSAAIRAIVLYPMNALVNDQLSRLRRILARGDSPEWQRQRLAGNVIHFGMYTSLAPPTGLPDERRRRERWEAFSDRVDSDWQRLRDDLRASGSWPRPDSPEMLCRWDMQQAPPDILVTNYSMLEYMLLRPIEAGMFERTREWLATDRGARLTLVLDEAHTYTGAKGIEVAHLVRRLKERLGIEADTGRFRGIATSASIPDTEGADERLRMFVADLFGEATQSFSLIRVDRQPLPPARADASSPDRARAFSRFQASFSTYDPWPAIDGLAQDLELGSPDRGAPPQVALYEMLRDDPDVSWVRSRTARRATLLDRLADEAFPGVELPGEREATVAGVLAAGSFARPSELPDTPPLLSTRIHAFFRGVSGLWACMDPDCPELSADDHPRPVGKLYTDPRPWCTDRCGARVLEVFSCRQCGLLFLGGVPDGRRGTLWPWADDLSGQRQELAHYRVFGVERPHPEYSPRHRNTRTTGPTHPEDAFARETYEVGSAEEDGQEVSPFPAKCPRCQNHRAPGAFGSGREIVEPLRTRGPRSMAVIVEDAFRVQPRAAAGPPNHGRKALVFSDSRQEASQLAADLREIHRQDTFRQMLHRVLVSCRVCHGGGWNEETAGYRIGQAAPRRRTCTECRGSGVAETPEPIRFRDLRSRVIELELDIGFDPTLGKLSGFFERVDHGDQGALEAAEIEFDVSLRRELAEDEFALEPLGLGVWRVDIPDDVGVFEGLTPSESSGLIQTCTRILATEDILLPSQPLAPWAWPPDLVRRWERQVLIRHTRRVANAIPFNVGNRRKLGRYLLAVGQSLLRDGRFRTTGEAAAWVGRLEEPLWEALTGLGILESAGQKIDSRPPYGIRIDRFVLHAGGGTVERCRACGFVMVEAPFPVCRRCGQATETTDPDVVTSFYRRAALFAAPSSISDDPYPLRATEHTAAVATDESRDIERWFQDLYRDDEEALDHRVDVLSVTTTMEMGIDIGSLLTVGLRNVPPTVANYQQRAGRAGRRGSAIATVLTYAQLRSHDQYYFHRPPEIVSEPPRVPTLDLTREVIVRRHVRSLVLHAFFTSIGQAGQPGLLNAWGRVSDFVGASLGERLARFVQDRADELCRRACSIVDRRLAEAVPGWIRAIPGEVAIVVGSSTDRDELLRELITRGVLPKYAFPVDVVSFATPDLSARDIGEVLDDGIKRDLRIALAEYAPGAEVLQGRFPNTYVFQSAGVYDAFARDPDYHASGQLVECVSCQGISLLEAGAPAPPSCTECGSDEVLVVPYLRPQGFTTDQALPNGGGELYQGGSGRERSGFTPPARLQLGQTSFAAGRPLEPLAPSVFTHVRVGDLFTANKGPDPRYPGYLICPVCGRCLDPSDPGSHTYPANVPPHRGRLLGPRAGSPCPNSTDFDNQVALGYRFSSEVLVIGVDLPPTLDAPFGAPSGRAVWHSFGTLVGHAASTVLQIDPGEIQVGVRPVSRGPGRVHGEIFISDNVPGGAGYARAINDDIERVLERALELGRDCRNPDCPGACYHCLLDYSNQQVHPLMDRGLGAAVLEFALRGQLPTVPAEHVRRSLEGLTQYATPDWTVVGAEAAAGVEMPLILEDRHHNRVGIWPIHPLAARPGAAQRQAALAATGARPAVHTIFDIDRRPLWVLDNLLAR